MCRRPGIWAIVPAYRAAASVVQVVRRVLAFVDGVVVVDDACPQASGVAVENAFDGDPRVVVARHAANRGVGGATKTGLRIARGRGAAIAIKIDADDQMDPSYIPHMAELLERYPALGMVKGNRFATSVVLRRMPRLRLIGNSALSFLVKGCTGYWNLVDPTNGYIACRADLIDQFDLDALSDRYFFEIDLLSTLGLLRIPIAELQMDAIYGGENSSLSLTKTLVSFPGRILSRLIRRIFFQYVLTDINVGSLYAVSGVPLLLGGIVFGGYQWYLSSATQVPRTSGTVILALLLFIVGLQLILSAITFDVGASSRTMKARVIGSMVNVRFGDAHPVVLDGAIRQDS